MFCLTPPMKAVQMEYSIPRVPTRHRFVNHEASGVLGNDYFHGNPHTDDRCVYNDETGLLQRLADENRTAV